MPRRRRKRPHRQLFPSPHLWEWELGQLVRNSNRPNYTLLCGPFDYVSCVCVYVGKGQRESLGRRECLFLWSLLRRYRVTGQFSRHTLPHHWRSNWLAPDWVCFRHLSRPQSIASLTGLWAAQFNDNSLLMDAIRYLIKRHLFEPHHRLPSSFLSSLSLSINCLQLWEKCVSKVCLNK